LKEIIKVTTLGILSFISISTGILTFGLAFAKNKDMQFEISDCQVQRTATTEVSGPCPEIETPVKLDNSFDNNMVESQIAADGNSEPTPIHSNLDDSYEQVDPFGPILK